MLIFVTTEASGGYTTSTDHAVPWTFKNVQSSRNLKRLLIKVTIDQLLM